MATSFNHTIAAENAKAIRQAFNYLTIEIDDLISGNNLFTFDIGDFISCNLDLRSVNTKFDNPSLEASSIDFQVYYNGTESDIAALMGKNVQMSFQCGYQNTDDPDDLSKIRTFYCTFTDDTIQYKNNILHIKGVDGVGAFDAKTDGGLYDDEPLSYPVTQDLTKTFNKFVRETVKPYFPYVGPALLANIDYDRTLQKTVSSIGDLENIYVPAGSRREVIAQLMNIFRGSSIYSASTINAPLNKKFIFRDAGIPSAGWAPTGIGDWPSVRGEDTMQTWELDYTAVADFERKFGTNISKITMEHHNCKETDQYTGSEDIEATAGTVIIYETGKPISSGGLGVISGNITITSSAIISPTKIKIVVGGSGTGTIQVSYEELMTEVMGSSIPNIEINTGISGEEIETKPPFYGYSNMDFTDADLGINYTNRSILEIPLTDQVNNNQYYVQPQWISFTWRGHPDMQPRDLIKFTEKDGVTKHYYEIDNLTLEFSNGGMVSKIEAILKDDALN